MHSFGTTSVTVSVLFFLFLLPRSLPFSHSLSLSGIGSQPNAPLCYKNEDRYTCVIIFELIFFFFYFHYWNPLISPLIIYVVHFGFWYIRNEKLFLPSFISVYIYIWGYNNRLSKWIMIWKNRKLVHYYPDRVYHVFILILTFLSLLNVVYIYVFFYLLYTYICTELILPQNFDLEFPQNFTRCVFWTRFDFSFNLFIFSFNLF